jgi:hypothetical protein
MLSEVINGIDTSCCRRAKGQSSVHPATFREATLILECAPSGPAPEGGAVVIVRAHWYVYPPEGPRVYERKTLVTDDDVDGLVAALGAPHVDDAYLTTDEQGAFVIHLAVRDGWGYLAWSDDEFLGSPAGDPNSPGTHGTFNTDYFPGTGLSPGMLARVLKDLLVTGDRPALVEWVSDDELES